MRIRLTILVAALVTLCHFASAEELEIQAPRQQAPKQWLDTFPKHVGFTWGANADLMSTYMWRGQYVGALSFQAGGNVGYGGAFINFWWNVGATSWKFNGLCPEMDSSIGFSRWGFFVLFMHMYYFDTYADGTPTKFFDFKNYDPGGGGVTTELRFGYKVSSKIPLSILWCTRFWGRDGYRNAAGELKRAYSTYIQLGYDFNLPYEMVLETHVGFTPWKSCYTGFKGDFAVTCIDVLLRRDWKLTDYCSLRVQTQLMLNPWRVDKENIKWSCTTPWEQRLNFNVGVGVYFN